MAPGQAAQNQALHSLEISLKHIFGSAGRETCERRLHKWLETLIKKKIITIKAQSEPLTGSF